MIDIHIEIRRALAYTAG